jgi:hypothetical protein
VVILATGTVIFAVVANANSDSTKIKKLVDRFAVAVDTQDQAAVTGLLCADEASDITGSDGYKAANNGGATQTTTKAIPVETTDVKVTGDTATARVSRPPQTAVTLHFKKENGTWKVCDPGSPEPAPSPSASPSR